MSSFARLALFNLGALSQEMNHGLSDVRGFQEGSWTHDGGVGSSTS
jgi:hypothetical protein